MATNKGSCLCGKVEFCVHGEFLYAGYCHCAMCRKSSGGAGTVVGGIQSEKMVITKGDEYIKRFHRSKETTSCFCNHCGSMLYGEKPSIGMVHIRFGALNNSPKQLPQAHMHVSSKPDWYDILDSLPQFAEFPPQE
jgi:hypothetical protein